MIIRKTIQKLSPVLLRAALFVALPVVVSCYGDDGRECPEEVTDTPVPVVVKITADREGDLNKRAYNNDENAVESEFMNTLCVYVVASDGKVEKVLQPDLSANAYAKEGNMYEYVFTDVSLSPGQKTFYAFSNWGDTEMAGVLSLSEGDDFSEESVLGIVVTNPAGKIKLTGEDKVFIPMTGLLEGSDAYVVAGQSRTFEIGLDRLVSRVRLTLLQDQAADLEIPVKSIAISGFADRVSLFSGTPLAEVTNGQSYTFDLNEKGVTNRSGYETGDFYVNETLGHPFTVEMITSEFGSDMVYTGTTSLNNLNRNSIYPLNLRISSMTQTIEAVMQAPPIGIVMPDVSVDVDGNYTINMVEGSTFTLTAQSPADGITYSYVWDTADVGNKAYISSNSGAALSGTLSAVSGMNVKLGLSVSWEKDGRKYTRKYTVTIVTIPLDEFDWSQVSMRSVGSVLYGENINLWKK